MTCFADDLQPSSLVVHEAEVYNALHNDSGTKTTR